jgi:NTP pyrophosphatase (non-canonical NTP hydrolase)
MKPDEYIKNVLKTESINFAQIKHRMSFEANIRLDHASDGLVTEAGEFKDTIKKYKFYGKQIDLTNCIEELGDALWYIAIACDVLNIYIEEVMEKNIAKLKARYGEKFNEEDALNRDLENERNILEDKIIHYISNPITHNTKTFCGIAHRFATAYTEDTKLITCQKCKEEMTRIHFDRMQ